MDKESDSFQIEKFQPIAFVWFFANFLPGNAYKNVVYIKKVCKRLISKFMASRPFNKQFQYTYCPISHEVKATRQ